MPRKGNRFLSRFNVSRLIHRRNGRRRTLLGLLGLIWLLYGWAIATSPGPNWQFGRLPSEVDDFLQNHWSGLLWAACGLVAICAAVLPRKRDSYGFTALLGPPLLWSVLYSWSWFISLITSWHGNPRAWVSALIWFFAVSVVFITAGWPDPTDDGDS